MQNAARVSLKPELGVIDASDGPSGLSTYLEMLWPALIERFAVTVVGDPHGPYARWADCRFVALPKRLRNADWRPSAEAAIPTSEFPARALVLKSLYRRSVPTWLKRSIGFARDVVTLSGVLKKLCLDVAYVPICGVEIAPAACQLAGVPNRVGTLHHLPPDTPWRTWSRRAVQRSLAGLTNAIAVSEAARRNWEDYVPSLRRRLHVVPNGIGVNEVIDTVPSRHESHFEATSKRIDWLAAGRLAPAKGFDVLIDAVALLKVKYPTIRVQIAGEGPLYDRLRERTNLQGVSQHVQFLGQVDDMARLYRSSRAFVLSSVTEAMPYVLLEAMSHGLPIVATRVGGVPEAIVNRQNGLLCPPQSPQLLAECMDAVMCDRKLECLLGDAACRSITENYSVDAMRQKTIDIFRCGASRKSGPARMRA